MTIGSLASQTTATGDTFGRLTTACRAKYVSAPNDEDARANANAGVGDVIQIVA